MSDELAVILPVFSIETWVDLSHTVVISIRNGVFSTVFGVTTSVVPQLESTNVVIKSNMSERFIEMNKK